MATFFVRLSAGGIFLLEGMQKFLFADQLGVGRFIRIGIPLPHVMAPFVGVVEIVCGSVLLLGLVTRFASLPLIIDMLVAITTTKIPILAASGFWTMAHEARVDWAMLMACLFLLCAGPGDLSLDASIRRKRHSTPVVGG
jgi:uncharacterized membrane protein YphA (DoxX/SURF4 family)